MVHATKTQMRRDITARIHIMCDQIRALRGERPRRVLWLAVLVRNKRLLIEKRRRNIREAWVQRRALQRQMKEAA